MLSGANPGGRRSGEIRSSATVGINEPWRSRLDKYHHPAAPTSTAPTTEARIDTAVRGAGAGRGVDGRVGVRPPPGGVGEQDRRREDEGEGLGQKGRPGDDGDERARGPRPVAADHPRQQPGQHGPQQDEEVVVVDRGSDVEKLRDSQGQQRGDAPDRRLHTEPAGRPPHEQGERPHQHHVDQPQHGHLAGEAPRPGVQVALEPDDPRQELVVEGRVLGQLVGDVEGLGPAQLVEGGQRRAQRRRGPGPPLGPPGTGLPVLHRARPRGGGGALAEVGRRRPDLTAVEVRVGRA